jgi:hypothetical protein
MTHTHARTAVCLSLITEGDPDKLPIIKDYKTKIETELVEICNDILGIIGKLVVAVISCCFVLG